MKNFTIVSDPGIDDLVGLVLMYKLNPSLKNCLVSSFGNGAHKITSRNAKEFIAFVANNWLYVDGAKLPLSGTVERPWPDYFHGPDGVWGVHPDVNTDSVIEEKKIPKNKDVISLSPMSDTLALLKEMKKKNFLIMAGAFNVEGNETKYAETNVAFDPDAAAEFFKNCNDASVKVVPLNVTRKVNWNLEKIESIPETNKVNKWLKAVLLAWFEKYNHEREESFNLHDPLTIYLTKYPSIAKWTKSGIEVVQKGEQRGRTIYSKENPECQIALDIINPSEVSDKIFDIIFKS